MSTHTPGPWVASVDPVLDRIGILAKGEAIVAMLRIDGAACRVPDARLIAAAPDLLAACEAAVSKPEGRTTHDLVVQIRSAIAKARGGK